MKKLLTAITCCLVVTSAMAEGAAQMGTLIYPSPLCESRTMALSAMLLSAAAPDPDVFAEGIAGQNCLYATKKDTRLKIHKMTKDLQQGTLVHYAEVSVISVGTAVASDEIQNVRYWIARPVIKGSKGYIQLDNGKFW